MKNISLALSFLLLFLLACKKDSVDASSTKSFQESINDMASSLTTLQQVKFNEALYIIKTFGVEGNNDIAKLSNMGKLLNGKKVPEILSLADQIAQKNGIAWSSTGPPSLGEMNIFGNENAKEFDANDVGASALNISVREVSRDSILGPKAIQIIPRLVNSSGEAVTFSGAALETTMEVYSGGSKLLTSKNLMTDNNFRGFTLKFSSLPKDKVIDNKIDVKVAVKTTQKTFQLIKAGIPINPKALLQPTLPTEENATDPNATGTEGETTGQSGENGTEPAKPKSDPKTTVSKFLNNLSAQNLRGAYDSSENPNWGSYDTFSNSTSGFGAVKGLSVKSVSEPVENGNTASVNATYDVTDNNGKTTPLKVTFGLKNVNGEWKISSYKIN